MSNRSNTFNIENVDSRIRNGFTKESFGVGFDGTLPCLDIVLVFHEGDLNAELGESVFEQVVGSAVD